MIAGSAIGESAVVSADGRTRRQVARELQRWGGEEDMGPAEFGLLMGEEGHEGGQEPLLADDWGAVENLDVFFTNMYKYYHSRGLRNIASRGVAHLLILAFTVLFSTFLLSFMDWKALLSCRDEDTCHPLSQYVTTAAFHKPNMFHVLVWMYMFLFLLYWLWSLLSLCASLRDFVDMHHLYNSRLGISAVDMHTIEWSEVVRRFLRLQNSGRYRVAIYTSDVTAHDIASRIMRKENYLIAMLNKGILKLSLPLPFLGSRSTGTLRATTGQQYLTKSLEWSVHFCVLNHMFSDKFTIRRAFLEDVQSLRLRLVFVGLAHVVLLPFLLLFMLVYFFLQNAQEWHSSKSYLGPREWSPLARWTFREFNELQHFFEQRMSGSYVHANAFLMRFPRPVLASLMRVTRFFSGAVVAVLLVMTVLEDSILLHVKVWDRNLLWYIGVFSAIYAFSRSVSPHTIDESVPQVESAEEAMLKVAAHTHYMPEHWVGRAHTLEVRKELLSLFHYKAQLFLEELLSVLLAPVILCFSMPSCAQEIVDFVADHTVDVEGVGSVCSYSLFDFGRYGDEDYAAPSVAPVGADSRAPAMAEVAEQEERAGGGRQARPRRRPDTTAQGKMEKSFLSFRANYPDWQPGAAGQEMIDRLAGFQLQCLRKDAEMIAAATNNMAAIVAGSPEGQGTTGVSHWGQSAGVPLDSPRFYGQNPASPWGVAGGRDGAAAATGHSGRHHHRGVGVENGQSAENEQSARGHKSTEEAFGGKEGEGGQGEQVRERRAGPREPRRVLALGEGRENGERGNADGDDDLDLGRDLERDRSSQQGFPLFSPPRVGGGLGGDRMSPPAASLTPSTLQLGLLNSVSPSMLLGPGAGTWLGGATGGIGSGGMSAAAGPSFVQTSQLAPLLLSQMNPHGSFGWGSPQFGRATFGAPAPPTVPVGQGQEHNFYWLEKFYAAHRSSAGLSPSASASGGSAFTGRGGGGGGRGNAPLRGQASASARLSQRSEVGAEGRGGRGAPRGARAGVVGVDADEAGYSMEMTFQQQPQQAQRRPRSQSPPLERDLGRESDGVP
ncbi:unnamed protein product [Ascophyllum nodosum]